MRAHLAKVFAKRRKAEAQEDRKVKPTAVKSSDRRVEAPMAPLKERDVGWRDMASDGYRVAVTSEPVRMT